jgi:predicted nucleic acid-binding protein
MSNAAAPVSYIIDTNIFDKLAADADALALAEQLVQRGEMKLLSTHIQRDEIAQVTDQERLQKLLSVPIEEVPTFGIVLGVSRIGMARFAPSEPLESLRAGEDRSTRTNDALIAMTAQFEQATLVTEDKDLRKRAVRHAIATIGWAEFRRTLVTMGAT